LSYVRARRGKGIEDTALTGKKAIQNVKINLWPILENVWVVLEASTHELRVRVGVEKKTDAVGASAEC
jgi:hypothetical protein